MVFPVKSARIIHGSMSLPIVYTLASIDSISGVRLLQTLTELSSTTNIANIEIRDSYTTQDINWSLFK